VVTGNQHDSLSFNAGNGEIRGCTMPQIMKDQVLNPLLEAQTLNLPVGMTIFLPFL